MLIITVKLESFYRFHLNQLAVFDRPGHGRDDSYQHACSRSNHVTQLTLFVFHTSSWSVSTASPQKCRQTNWSLGKIKIEQILANETGDRRQSGAIKTQMSWGVVKRCNYTVHCEPLWAHSVQYSCILIYSMCSSTSTDVGFTEVAAVKNMLLITTYLSCTMKRDPEHRHSLMKRPH